MIYGLDGTAIAVAAIGALGLVAVAIIGLLNGRAVRGNAKGVERIERQLRPNNGHSAFDILGHRFDRLEERMDMHADEMGDVKLAIGDMAASVVLLMQEAVNQKQWVQEHEAEIAAEREQRRR